MEPYWSYTYNNIEGIGEQKIDLYKYSAKCIALKTSHGFGRSFSKHLKNIGGKFNISLLNFERYFPFRIRKILTIPLTVIFNYLDNIFFKDNKNNLSIAIIAEKIDDL